MCSKKIMMFKKCEYKGEGVREIRGGIFCLLQRLCFTNELQSSYDA